MVSAEILLGTVLAYLSHLSPPLGALHPSFLLSLMFRIVSVAYRLSRSIFCSRMSSEVHAAGVINHKSNRRAASTLLALVVPVEAAYLLVVALGQAVASSAAVKLSLRFCLLCITTPSPTLPLPSPPKVLDDFRPLNWRHSGPSSSLRLPLSRRLRPFSRT
jgi:hypothetical protein